MKFLIPYAAITGAALLCSSVAFANDTETLDTVVVTASRIAQTQDEALAAVTVITRDDIELWQADSVAELLTRVPGISISSNGGAGQATSVFLRGAESDQVLVLVNGVKAGAATTGLAPFQFLPVGSIERIEVVRGPRASLYGSEAVGGVIQIFTRQGAGKIRPYLSSSVGRYESYNHLVGVNGTIGELNFDANVEYKETDGFTACKVGAGSAFAGCFTDEPDNDGHRQTSGSLRVGYQPTEKFNLQVSALHTDSETEFDSSLPFNNESKGINQTLGLRADYQLSDSIRLETSIGQTKDKNNSLRTDSADDRIRDSNFNTLRREARILSEISVSDNHAVVFGADYIDDEADLIGTNYDFPPPTFTAAVADSYALDRSRYNTGYYAQYIGTFDEQSVQLAFRNDENGDFGSHGTGSAAYGWNFSDTARFMLSYGTAFKAPSFNELFFPGFGNTELQPEKSRTLEIGFAGTPAWGSWSLNLFRSDVENLIEGVSDPETFQFVAVNVDKAKIDGIEISASRVTNDTTFGASLSLIDAVNRSPRDVFGTELQGKQLARRPKYTMQFDLDHRFINVLTAGVSAYFVGESFDNSTNSRRLDQYELLDARLTYQATKDFSIQLKVENLFDRNYENSSFYEKSGRAGRVTLRYQPQ